jgi:hypothetical protein
VVWTTSYFGPVTTTINGVAIATSTPATVDFDNRGAPQLGAVVYKISRGGSQNDETGTFY